MVRDRATGPIHPAPGSFVDTLAPAVRAELLTLGVRRGFDPGHVLLREGSRDDHVELLLRGFVKITTAADGLETLLAIRLPGDLIGETAAITGRPRNATATTCGRVSAAVISSADLRRFFGRHPDAAVSLTAAVGERLRWANQRRADFTAFPAEIRLARILSDLAQRCGRPAGTGIEIGVTLSQTEVASMVGIAHATAQKAIRYLREEKLIDTGYRRIVVLDPQALHKLGDGTP